MSKTTFSTKCLILGQMWFWYKDTDNDSWSEFFEWGDIGLPLAYMISQDYATAKPEGKEMIEQAWSVFCEMIEIDAENKYESLQEAFSASSHSDIDA